VCFPLVANKQVWSSEVIYQLFVSALLNVQWHDENFSVLMNSWRGVSFQISFTSVLSLSSLWLIKSEVQARFIWCY